jgi:hypothetical protein
MMKKFLKISSIYCILIVLYIIVGEYFLSRIKENTTIKTAIKHQMESKEECYYGRALFSEAINRYKFESLQCKKPTILTLGQSIVMNFRDFFFHPLENEFYNTGLMAKTVADFVYFSELIEQGVVKKPELIIIGIDHTFVIGHNGLDKEKGLRDLETDQVYECKEHLRAIQTVFLDSDVREVPTIDYGFGKKGMVGNGYRKDGSFAYKWETLNLVNDSIHNQGPKLNVPSNKYRYGENVFMDSIKVKTLFEVLNKYRNMGIEVLIYIPPFSDELYIELMRNEKFKAFWSQYLHITDQMEAQHFDVIKFTTPSRIGLTDYSMNNANHPSDVMVAKQFYAYCISSTRKNKFIDKIDTAYLKKAIDAPQTNCLSFMLDRWN